MVMFIGLDVHSKQTVACVQDSAGKVLLESIVETSEQGLRDFVRQVAPPRQTLVGLETGTQATWVARLLGALDLRAVVIEASEVRAKARRRGQKCDRRDAFEICDGLRRDQWQRIVWIPPASVERLRLIVSRRRHFVRLCTQQVNAAKFLLRSRGIATMRLGLTSDAAWQRLVSRPDAASVSEYLAMHARLWHEARRVVARLEEQLDEALQPFRSQAQLLMTAPGIGTITAACFLATLGDPNRFPTASHVVSYLGLAPSIHDSGQRQRHGHITRQGAPATRAVLVEAAHQARRANHPLNPYYRLLVPQKGVKFAVVAVAARLTRILWRLWRDGQRFDPVKLNVERKPLQRSKTYLYRLKETQPSPTA